MLNVGISNCLILNSSMLTNEMNDKFTEVKKQLEELHEKYHLVEMDYSIYKLKKSVIGIIWT